MAKIVAEHSYSDAELLALYRQALAEISVGGQSHVIRGKTFTHADIDKVKRMIGWLENRIATAAGTGTTNTRHARR